MRVNEVYEGDCLDVMRQFPDNCIDSIVTDPPYGLSFMGKDWDYGLPGEVYWREALRVAKPGATLMAFGGTRTHHRLACAIEDAGWEIRDCVNYFNDGTQAERAFMASLDEEQLAAYLELHYPGRQMSWVYGAGFPKAKRVNEDASPLMSKGDTCQCGENKNNNENTYPLQDVLDHICKVAVWEPRERDVHSNGHYETNKPQDFLGGYRHGFRSCDELLRLAVKNVLSFLRPQECVPEHNRFVGHADDWGVLSLHSLYRVLYNDLRANKGYFHPLQIEPVLQLLQEHEDENTPLLDLHETLNKLGGALNVLKLLDDDKSVCRNIHIYSLVFCLPLSILRIVNSRKYDTIIPQMVICGKCGKLRNIWEGYTSCGLKPAYEPVVIAQKPIDQNYAHNAERWGVAGLNIDGARVPAPNGITKGGNPTGNNNPCFMSKENDPRQERTPPHPKGRWPANVIHDGSDEVEAEFAKAGVRTSGAIDKNGKTFKQSSSFLASERSINYKCDKSQGSASRYFAQCPPDPTDPNPCLTCDDCLEDEKPKGRWPANVIHDGSEEVEAEFAKAGVSVSSDKVMKPGTKTALGQGSNWNGHNNKERVFKGLGDTGTPSRFFAQCPPDPTQHPEAARFTYCPKAPRSERSTPGNNHPTVKPLSLVKYLVRLTKTPTGGIVLDPFAGSGTTALACIAEGREYILIEKEPEYAELCRRRIAEYTGQEIAPVEIEIAEDEKVKQLALW